MYNQENGREDMYEEDAPYPKDACITAAQGLQRLPNDDVQQGKETLNVAMGALSQQSDTGKPEGWKTPSKTERQKRKLLCTQPQLLALSAGSMR